MELVVKRGEICEGGCHYLACAEVEAVGGEILSLRKGVKFVLEAGGEVGPCALIGESTASSSATGRALEHEVVVIFVVVLHPVLCAERWMEKHRLAAIN